MASTNPPTDPPTREGDAEEFKDFLDGAKRAYKKKRNAAKKAAKEKVKKAEEHMVDGKSTLPPIPKLVKLRQRDQNTDPRHIPRVTDVWISKLFRDFGQRL